MLTEPMIRSNICINSHSTGCCLEAKRQIEEIKSLGRKHKTSYCLDKKKADKLALVLGCSTGYGAAARDALAFEYGYSSIGVSYEKEAIKRRAGTPGYYNNCVFDREAKKEGLYSKTFNMDAYAKATREAVIKEIKESGKKLNLLVYSLASPVRPDENKIDKETGRPYIYRSVIKPIGSVYKGQALDIVSLTLKDVETPPATKQEIEETIKVMGGEDWQLWINDLMQADVLAEGFTTIAFSYIGPKLSHSIYRDGTIGEAKKDLERVCNKIHEELQARAVKGRAFISVNKGLVTRSSAVIPIISLYLAVLFKVMKGKKTHEDCVGQMERLFREKLLTAGGEFKDKVETDSERRIRIDNYELDKETQEEVDKIMHKINKDNFTTLCDIAEYKHDFLAINGFDIAGVDYDKKIEDATIIE